LIKISIAENPFEAINRHKNTSYSQNIQMRIYLAFNGVGTWEGDLKYYPN